jgi:hypothetical protein
MEQDHPLDWATYFGWALVFVAIMSIGVVSFLPVFEGYRAASFEFVIGPAVVVGLLLVTARIYFSIHSTD